MSDLEDKYLKEIKRLKKKKSRGDRPSCCCCSFFLVGILFCLTIAILIKVGVIKVPVLSGILYKEITPTREILAAEPVKDIQSVIVDFATQTVALTEQQLTGLVQQYFSQSLDPALDATSQVVVTKDFVELSGTLQKPIKIPFVAQVIPLVTSDNIEINVKQIQLGSIVIPPFLTDLVTDRFLPELISQVEQGFSNIGSIESFNLTEGTLQIDAKLAN